MTHDELDDSAESGPPVWAVFGDLMAGLLGAFVLILVCVMALQFDLAERLKAEVAQRETEVQRRETLERALAGPLASGRVTLADGRIGINGNVLFEFNSAELQPEGRRLMKTLAGPLATYLASRDEVLMVSGFTDDRPMRSSDRAKFTDNWELSAQRALTVTRALIEDGVPAPSVFAAAFGAQQPVASNGDAAGRALNRRVEMAPTPRAKPATAAAAARTASAPT